MSESQLDRKAGSNSAQEGEIMNTGSIANPHYSSSAEGSNVQATVKCESVTVG